MKKIWEGVNEIIPSRKIEKDGSISAIIAVGATITDSQKVKSQKVSVIYLRQLEQIYKRRFHLLGKGLQIF